MKLTREVQAHTIEKDVIWFIRHPIKRLQSCYHYFQHTTEWPDISPDSYESFVDAVLDGAKNRHWDAQAPQVTHGKHFLPTEIYRFEDINKLWLVVIGGELPHRNPSIKTEINKAYRLEELAAFYRMDIEKWQHALTADTKT